MNKNSIRQGNLSLLAFTQATPSPIINTQFDAIAVGVSETCRLQNRNAYQYLSEAMQAKFASKPVPALLPDSKSAAAAA